MFKLTKLAITAALFGLLLGMPELIYTQKNSKTKKVVQASDDVRRANSSADIFRIIMGKPDSRIPKAIFDKADCVAVFPNVLKGAFIIGGRYGKGLVSCRTGTGWSSPAFMRMRGGSFGWQIGGQSTDFVLLFMTEEGIDSLLSNEFTLGTEASVAAGPIGRTAGASTDLYLESQILSYSRSKGAFAGISLKGVSVGPDDEANEDVYGEEGRTAELIKQRSTMAPAGVRVFPNMLSRYSNTRR